MEIDIIMDMFASLPFTSLLLISFSFLPQFLELTAFETKLLPLTGPEWTSNVGGAIVLSSLSKSDASLESTEIQKWKSDGD